MIGDKRGPRAHKENETSPPRQSWPSFDLALELSQDWWRKRTKQPGDEEKITQQLSYDDVKNSLEE